MPREPPHSNGCGPAAPATGQLQPSTRDSQLPEEKNNPIIFPHTTPFFVGRSETLSWNHPLPAGGSQPLPCCYPLCCLPLLWEPPTPKYTDSTGKKGAKAFTMSPTAAAGNRSASFSRHLFPHPQSASLPAQALSCQEVQGHIQHSTVLAASISQLHGTCGAGADEEAGTSPR